MFSNLTLSWVLHFERSGVCLPWVFFKFLWFFLPVIHPYDLSVMVFLFPYLAPKLFCFLCIQLFICACIFFINYDYHYYQIGIVTWNHIIVYKSLVLNINTLYYIKVKLATSLEGDLKTPFSIATTPKCRGGHYSIPRIAPLYPWSSTYAEC